MNKVKVIAFSFKKGGAAIAASKFNKIANEFDGFEITTVSQDSAKKSHFLKRLIAYSLNFLQYDFNPIKHSLNLFSYPPVIKAFENTSDIHHLHWFNNDTLSVFSLNKIPFASLITLHDEWLYCGSEHYFDVSRKQLDFIHGYKLFQRNVLGFSWNYFIWRLKLSALQQRNDILYTVPSLWMKERAESSVLLSGKKIILVPNPIDTEIFKPYSSQEIEKLRVKHKILPNDFVFSFGAIGGSVNPLKGARELRQSLEILRSMLSIEDVNRIKIIQFGGKLQDDFYISDFKCISVGHISEPSVLAELYNISDCVVVPSLVESFGQVAAESLSCAVPVVCFSTSGLKDIVFDNHSGMTAEPFSVESLASCLKKMYMLSEQLRNRMGANGRNHVLSSFSYPVVSKLYYNLLNQVAECKKIRK